MIEISGVTKVLEGRQILQDISFSADKGSIHGLIGPNGAGKTTLIKLLTGIWQPDAGSIKIAGEPVFENIAIKAQIGYVPDFCHYYELFRVQEIMKIYMTAYPTFDRSRFEEINEIFKIDTKKTISSLSKGTRTRLMFLFSLSIRPNYLILDEPTSGLDPIAMQNFFEMLLDEVAARGTTVIISSHMLRDIEQVCDSITMINSGQIRFSGSIDTMKKQVRKYQAVFTTPPAPDVLGQKDILSCKNIGSVYHIVSGSDSKEFKQKLTLGGASFVEEIDISLEEIFIHTMGGDQIYAEIYNK